MPSVALYARVSTTEQAEHGYSIDEQISRMKAYCQAMSWSIYKVYSDPGFSGASTDRPALKLMLSDIQEKQVDTVLVYKLDRLSRSQKDALYLIEDEFLNNGVNFVSISENFDTGTPLGRAMIGILAVFAQLEREQIKERMTLGRDARAAAGKWHGGGFAPIGYEYDPVQGLTVNEYEAVYIRRIFELSASGVPCIKIVEQLHKDGVRHKYGEFSEKRVVDIIRNTLYVGQVRMYGKQYPGVHKALVDKETFEKANAVLDANGELWARRLRSSRNQSLLSGLIVCGRCGAKYHKRKFPRVEVPRYICASRSKHGSEFIKDPTCKNKIYPVPELDSIIINEVKKLSADPKALKKIIGQKAKPAADDKKVLTAQMAKLRRQLSKYMDLYAIEEIDIETVKEKIEPLNRQISALEKEIEKQGAPAVEPEGLALKVAGAADLIGYATDDEKREILRSLIDKIVIDGDSITVHWNFG